MADYEILQVFPFFLFDLIMLYFSTVKLRKLRPYGSVSIFITTYYQRGRR